VDNEIISYIEMCQRESSSLQRGMNFDLGAGYAVILMSVTPMPRTMIDLRTTGQL